MKKLIVIGGGGHAVSCLDVVGATGEFLVKGILDPSPNSLASELGYEYLGDDSELKHVLEDGDFALIAVGQIKTYQLRKKLFEKSMREGAKFTRIVSPNAYCSQHSHLGDGTIVMHGAIVNSKVSIGQNLYN